MPMTDDQIADFQVAIQRAKKKPTNFAICLGMQPEGTIALSSKTKEPEQLERLAKAAGETKKVAYGTMEVTGSKIFLTCQGDVPTGISKSLRAMLAKHKLSFSVVALDSKGIAADGGDEAGNKAGPATSQTATQTETTTTTGQTSDETVAADPEWQRLLDGMRKDVEDFIAGGSEKAPQIKVIWTAAQAAAAKGHFGDAKAAAARIAAAIGSPGGQKTKDAGEDELVNRIEGAIKGLMPRVQDALKRLPSLNKEVLGLIQSAREAAKGGDAGGAADTVRKIATLLDRVEKQMSDAGQGIAGVSVAKLSKARIDWRDVRGTALTDVGTLKSRIRNAFSGLPQDVRQEVEEGLKTLDAAVAELNDELGVELDKILNEGDAGKRAALARDLGATTRKFLNLTRTHPVISAIDDTVYMPGVKVVAPLTKTLNDILDAIAQSAPEPAN